MDIDPLSLPDDGSAAGPSTQPDQPTLSTPRSNVISKSAPALRRQLRARPSDLSAPSSSPATKKARSDKGAVPRQPTDKELAFIQAQLSEDGLKVKRDAVIRGKEMELKTVVDGHDDAVREKFHLERFISIVTGWDPKVAKQDASPVFLEYKRANHNLLDLLPSIPPSQIAGPSRPRASFGSRTTRRQANEQADLFSSEPVALPEPIPVPEPTRTITFKGKGKARQSELDADAASEAEVEAVQVPFKRPVGRPKKIDAGAMLPPPIPVKGKGKGRRATIGIEPGEEVIEGLKEEELGPGGAGKGKKRGRQSMPNLSKKRDAKPEDQETEPLAEEPSPEPEAEAGPSTKAPALPSLAHLPFPPPPTRPRPRPRGTRKIYYTDYSQLPTTVPQYGGDLTPIIESFTHLEDTGPPPDAKALEIRALNVAYYRNRVNYLQHQGRLLRLLDDDEDEYSKSAKISTKPPTLPPRQVDFQDSLIAHMIQVQKAMINEARLKPIISRKIAKMVQAYWDHIEGKDDRERLAEEKKRKLQMKDLIKSLRRRWALAVKVVRAKFVQLQKEEQDRLGKEHLQNMLERSSGLLDAHRDEFAGREGDSEDDSGEEESSGTESVSSAEDSEDEDEDEDEEDDGDGDEVKEEGDEGDDESQAQTSLDVDLDQPVDLAVDSAAQSPLATELKYDDEDSESLDGSNSQPEDIEDVGTRALLVDHDEKMEDSVVEPNGAAELLDLTPMVDSNDISVAETPAAPAKIISPRRETGPTGSPNGDIVMTTNGSTQADTIPSTEMNDTPNGSPAAVTVNSQAIDQAEVDDEPEPVITRPKSKRQRQRAKRLLTGSATPETDDPDAGDIEFKTEQASDIDEKDHEMDIEMEDDDEGDQADSEDDGLLADANIPIEELLKRYGYTMPVVNGHEAPIEPVEEIERDEGQKIEEMEQVADDVPKVELVGGSKQEVDQSLIDAALPDTDTADPALMVAESNTAVVPGSPVLVVEGKRQRRVRSVWSPQDNPPPPPRRTKKPKVQLIDPKGEAEPLVNQVEEDDESDPQFTSSEEESSEEEEVVDEHEPMDEDGKEPVDPNRLKAPFLLRGSLRPYQHAGLEWLASLYTNNMNGILADEMGLGKTIQTISLLAHLACDKGIWGQHLIIVPTSVILNWEMEFKKFLPGMKVLTYYGNQKERKEKRVGWQTQHHFQVCITSYQIVLADQHIFRRKNWVYMILDEAHNIKNFRSQRWQTLLGFKAQRRLLLTGTPLQNNLMELWSLLYFLMPGGVGADATAVVGFANHKEFTEWFSNPMDKAVESGDVVDEEIMATISKLHTLLRPYILRRLKSEVETQLPGKFEHVVYCKLSKRQRFLYDEFMARASTKEALSSGGYLGVVNTLMQLRKVCNHPDLFEVRPVRTSFAMDPVVGDYEPVELLIRKRLLAERDEGINLEALNLRITGNEDSSAWVCQTRQQLDASDRLPYAIEPVITKKGKQPVPPPLDTLTVDGWLKYRAWNEEQKSISRWRSLRDKNRVRCASRPIYGSTLLSMLSDIPNVLHPLSLPSTRPHCFGEHDPPASTLVSSLLDRSRVLEPLVNLYAVIPPNVVARDLPRYALPGFTPLSHPTLTEPSFDTLHQSTVKLQIAFPDSSLLQYDCGKLQTLYTMLRDLKANGHRVLIFTQMTRVLDILEMFLSYNGHRYLRLDGSTKIEDRQIITERFNSDSRIFCFIASSRSGGVGINLTGADTVFFYDSDWNPSMDRQCMDRAHRIGQTREVHIYRFVSTHTVEENMLKKANQKRMLDKVVIQEGDFTTDFFGKMDWRDVIESSAADVDVEATAATTPEGKIEDIDVEDESMAVDQNALKPRAGEERELARALAEVEDEEDAAAARIAQGEGELDFEEFDGENRKIAFAPAPKRIGFERALEEGGEGSGTLATPAIVGDDGAGDDGDEDEEEAEEDDGIGGVDEYMLKFVEWNWDFFVSYRA